MSAVQVDEDLYSRQLYVLGVDAMKKVASSSVLISGMGGVGVEIAKNIILAGIKNVTIHDTRTVTMLDLAAQFYLDESKIGKNRAIACYNELIGLNSYVSVAVETEELNAQSIKKYNCVVLTDWRKYSEIKSIAETCHANNIRLIVVDCRGVFGYIFTDFGATFVSSDVKGERPSRFLISMITNSEEGKVTIDPEEMHDLTDGDHVLFEEVEGMTELNGKEFEVKVLNPKQFTIGDTTKFGQYTSVHRSGYGNQVIVPKEFHYMQFEEALKNINNNKIVQFDWGCFGRDQQVVLAFIAMSKVIESTNTPKMTFEQLLAAAKEINGEFKIVEEIDESLLKHFAAGTESVISPTCAVFGGIAGQEVLKAVSSKFTPIDQFLGIGYIEALQENPKVELKGDRYDPYRMIFGNEQQEAMQNLRYFMLGAGALGCEMLKNWAMMGVATKGNGKVIVTDMDSIERSNLNRQFLFRDKDIGKMKSTAAGEAAQVMNKDIKVEAHTNRVGPESANIYNDEFFNALSGVCNALDNVQTRLYSDSQCVFYKKPMLESGTLGTKAHFQMIVPYLTESYASMADPPEKEIPQCTLHNFPSNLDHCCMWARDIFTGVFESAPTAIAKFIEDPEYITLMQKNDPGNVLPTLRTIKELMITHRPKTFEDCVRWAKGKFEELFVDKINELRSQFPRDFVSETGVPFWTGHKRFPSPIDFNSENPEIANFIRSSAQILARIFHVKVEGDAFEIAKKVESVKYVPPKRNPEDDMLALDDAEKEELTKELEAAKATFLKVVPEEFEKDDDSNGHMDFVSAAANLRATNYEIANAPKLEIKRIAGKIIPAIATTTAMICGFVSLEMYKIHSVVPKKLEDFRSGFINLALSLFGISEPMRCTNTKCPANDKEYNLWTTWDIEGDVTVQEFIDQAKEKYNVNVDMITVGNSLVYMSYMNPESKRQQRLGQKITDVLVNELKQAPLESGQFYVNVTPVCVDADDNEVETPAFRLVLKK